MNDRATESVSPSEHWSAAHAATAHLHQHLDAVPLGVVVLDVKGAVVYINPAMVEKLGWPFEEIRGRDWFQTVIGGEEAEAMRQRYTYAIETREIRNPVQNPVHRRDGRIIHMRWSNTMISAKDGSVIGSVSYGEDVTDRTKMEESMRLIAQEGWKTSDEPDFFRALARHLTQTLEIDFAFIGERVGDELQSIRTLAGSGPDGPFSISYDLEHTPCQDVFSDGDMCVYSRDIAKLYRKDEILVDMKAESYIGIPLLDSRKSLIGLIALIGLRPLENEPLARALLQQVAIRASAELERRRADQAIAAMERRQKSFISTSLAGFWWYEVIPPVSISAPVEEQIDQLLERAVLTECNEIYARSLGFNAASEILDKPIHEILPSDGSAREIVRTWIEHGHRFPSVEIEQRLRTGETRLFSYLAEGVIEDGCLVRGWGTHVDLTDQRRVESELRVSQNIVDQSRVITMRVDADGRVQYINEAGLEIFGYNRDNSAELLIWEMDGQVTPENWSKWYDQIRLQRVMSFDTTCHRRDGSTFPAEVTAAYTEFDGQPFIVGFVLDQTNLRQAEEQLRYTQYSIDHCRNMVCWVDGDGNLEYTNAAMHEWFGYDADEFEGKRLCDFDTSRSPQQWTELLSTLRADESLTMEATMRRKDGVEFPCEINANFGRFEGKAYIFCFMQDITDRKAAEKALVEQAESERRLLIEIDHRVRNNLASLIAMIELSRGSAGSIDDLAVAIRHRTQAIASVHAALARSKWQAISITDLARDLIQPPLKTRVYVDGPPVLVPPGQAQALGIILNELATNCMKYGAMSSNDGRLDLTWTLEEDGDARSLVISWLESGVDITPPARRGSGLSLIEGLVQSELRGTVDFQWNDDGAAHTIAVSLQTAATAQFSVT